MKNPRIFRTCDDFGIHLKVNKSILRACENQKIHLVSCVVNDITSQSHDFETLRNYKVLYALHLNVTEGQALSSNNRFWVTRNNEYRFGYSSLFLLNLLIPRKTQRFLVEEFHAQFKVFLSFFETKFTFINSHNHILSLPSARRALKIACEGHTVSIRARRYLNLKWKSKPAKKSQRWKKLLYILLNAPREEELNQYCKEILQLDWDFALDLSSVSEINKCLKDIENHPTSLEIIFHLGFNSEDEDDRLETRIRESRYRSFYSNHARKIEEIVLEDCSEASSSKENF